MITSSPQWSVHSTSGLLYPDYILLISLQTHRENSVLVIGQLPGVDQVRFLRCFRVIFSDIFSHRIHTFDNWYLQQLVKQVTIEVLHVITHPNPTELHTTTLKSHIHLRVILKKENKKIRGFLLLYAGPSSWKYFSHHFRTESDPCRSNDFDSCNIFALKVERTAGCAGAVGYGPLTDASAA